MKRSDGQLTLRLPEPPDPARAPAKPRKPGLPRLSVSPDEAASMLGVSRDFFDEHIRSELRIIRRGRKLVLIPISELTRWIDNSAARFSL
jgi:excisionase family DNA binding protein